VEALKICGRNPLQGHEMYQLSAELFREDYEEIQGPAGITDLPSIKYRDKVFNYKLPH
jgi:hypothetical protein